MARRDGRAFGQRYLTGYAGDKHFHCILLCLEITRARYTYWVYPGRVLGRSGGRDARVHRVRPFAVYHGDEVP
jgi:hypothetical protein